MASVIDCDGPVPVYKATKAWSSRSRGLARSSGSQA